MKMIFLTGPLRGNRYRIDSDITLGRDTSNEIVVPDPSVSLVHCQILMEDGVNIIKDLGSTNGIAVNDERLIRTELADGDRLLIGSSRMCVEIADDIAEEEHQDLEADIQPEQEIRIQEDSPPLKTDIKELSGNIFGSVTYFLKRKIADGGMGAVYEAEQFGAEGFIKKVAIKTILPSYVKKNTFVSSFIGEAKLVANLVHQNIVQIHHFGRHDDGYYIAMEFIDGINLTDFMRAHHRRRRKIPLEIATFIVSRICRGMEYAHNKKDDRGKSLRLVHRDVSPNNIMLTREGEVKLTDFGVAKAAQFMETHEGDLVGSVEYMSPEQAACQEIDARSDIFSLGLVYYELLTGARVFICSGDDIDETVEHVKAAVIPDPRERRPDLPDQVVNTLMKCLKADPGKRYQTAGDLGCALEKEIYSKGYGPTIVTLAEHLSKLT
jgi:serine/threonine protein kinase